MLRKSVYPSTDPIRTSKVRRHASFQLDLNVIPFPTNFNFKRSYVELMTAVAFFSLGQAIVGQTREFVSNSRLQLGTESNLSASVRSGDFDGDGDIDLVVANGRHWPQQNYIFLNDGRGQFSRMRPLGSDRATTYACEVADMDSDGDLDIVTGNAMAPCNIFINNGEGRFQLKLALPTKSSVRSLTLADIDLDNDFDILLTCRGRTNQIFYNEPTLSFTDIGSFGTRSDSTIAVQVGDIDHNGLPDLVAANRDNQSNMLVFQKSAGKFENRVVGSRQNSRSVTLGDFDGDKRIDAAYANIGAENTITFADGLRSSVDPTASSVTFGQPSAQSYAIASADLDLDGDLDLVVGNVMSANVAYFNAGDGKTFSAVPFGSQEEATYGLCIADLNGDRYPDIAVANSGALNRVYLNRPSVDVQKASRTIDAQQTTAQPLGKPPADFSFRAEGKMTTGSSPKLTDSDWPAFRGRGAQGISELCQLPSQWNAGSEPKDEDESDGRVLWRVDIPGLGHSSPIVVGDRVFVATAVSEAGDAPLQVGRSGRPTAADDDGIQSWEIHCFDKLTGKPVWTQIAHRGIPKATRHAKATHANGTLASDGSNLVAFFGSEGLYCFDVDGHLLWKRDLGIVNISKYGIGWGYASSPTISGNDVLLVCDDPTNPYLVAIDIRSGEERWRVDRSGDTERNWSTPFVYETAANGKLVVVNGWPAVVAYRLTDGEEVWRIQGGGDNPVPTPFIADDHLFITSAHGSQSPIHAIRLNAEGDLTEKTSSFPNDAFLWSTTKGGCYMSTPVVYRGNLYLGNSNGVIRCFNAENGELQFEQRLASNAGIIASLVAGDGKIYCASESGYVYVLAAGDEFKLISRNPMGNPLFATPAISNKMIYFRSTSELVAIEASH